MQYHLTAPTKLRGRIQLPASKSISNRVLVINALAGNQALPENVSDCDDTRVMLRWLCGAPSAGPRLVDVGAAGTAMRFSTALLAVTVGEATITGTERMRNRPIGVLVDALRALGAQIDYVEKEGFPPLRIVGNSQLAGGEVSLPGNVSSQYISALLMIAPVLREGLLLTLTEDIVSRPYINLTMQLMRMFGAEVEWVSDRQIRVGTKKYERRAFVVENDWSASSYWYEMLALTDDPHAEICLPDLMQPSMQGDSKVAELFRQLGVETHFAKGEACLAKNGERCARMDYDFVNEPDLAQTFVATCCLLGIPFHFTGLQSLKIKETDRIAALRTELRKMGFEVQEANGRELIWNGERTEPMAGKIEIDTYEDHRMAMAFAPCSLKYRDLWINNPQVVTKSYPNFWENLRHVGFEIAESED